MNIRKLSIIIPAYNEANTIAQLLYGVVNAPLPSGIEKEIIIIDDCSTDNTALQVRKVQQSNPNAHIIYTKLKENKGKGFAVRTGIKLANGEAIIIQDADLEYDPNDYTNMLQLLCTYDATKLCLCIFAWCRDLQTYPSFYISFLSYHILWSDEKNFRTYMCSRSNFSHYDNS